MKNNAFFMGNLNKKNYFEGWYFKQVLKNGEAFAIIPGIAIKNHKKEAFIQIIETFTNKSYYLTYDIKEISLSKTDYYIKIKDNYFSKDKIILNIDTKDLKLFGELKFSNLTPLSKTVYRPTIMGPFSYIKNMQCNHAIISMHHTVNGTISLNNKKIKLKNATGYIEKDYGTSFPKKYLWLHSNTSKTTKKISLTLSVANIPLGILSFQGFFCTLLINNKEYYFTTYYKDSLKLGPVNESDDDNIHIQLRNNKYQLDLLIFPDPGINLIAPINGTMEKPMKENLTTNTIISLKELKTNKKVHDDCLINSGFEYVKE